MTILAMRRDSAYPNSRVAIVSNDTLATVATTGYLTAQATAISNVNNGPFVFDPTDFVSVSASNGGGIYNVSANFSSLIPITV